MFHSAWLGTTLPLRRYTHSDNVDEPLLLETFDASGSYLASYHYHADHLGSIRYITDAAGQIVAAYDYDSYGRVTSELALIAQPFRYTGREWDEAAQLYHYRARGYDPSTGRFIQEDPIGFAAGDLNIYRYVLSNPLTYTDPSGLAPAISHAQLRSRALKSGSLAIGIGLGLSCLFNSIADGVELAGEPGLTELNLLGCTAEAVIGSVGGAILGRGISKIASSAGSASWRAYQRAVNAGAKQGGASGIITKNGNEFHGFSAKAGGLQQPLHPLVQAAMKKYGGNPCGNRRCAELDALSNALRAGDDLAGARITTRNLGGNNRGAPGDVMEPCNRHCRQILAHFGVRF